MTSCVWTFTVMVIYMFLGGGVVSHNRTHTTSSFSPFRNPSNLRIRFGFCKIASEFAFPKKKKNSDENSWLPGRCPGSNGIITTRPKGTNIYPLPGLALDKSR